MRTATLGFPRMGRGRALKWLVEKYFRGEVSELELLRSARELRLEAQRLQANVGISEIPSGDFSLYDHVLDLAQAMGTIGDSVGRARSPLTEYCLLARGKAPTGETARALEMTKWFDTNYHFLVPQIGARTELGLRFNPYRRAFQEALAEGITTRPVLVGPVTFFRLSRDPSTQGPPPLERFGDLLTAYEQLLRELEAAGATSVQLDEPSLCLENDETQEIRFREAYSRLAPAGPPIQLTTYFGSLEHRVELLAALPVRGIHVDLCVAPEQLGPVLDALRSDQELSLGLVDGRNVWRNDLERSLSIARPVVDRLGVERCIVATSCSLLHVPRDLDEETHVDDETRSWLSFAVQKTAEVCTLARGLAHGREAIVEDLERSHEARLSRARSPRVRKDELRAQVRAALENPLDRAAPYAERSALQQERLSLPLLPTTTIGSFPQTQQLRRARVEHRSGRLSDRDYDALMEREIASNIRRQEEIGLDVFVHGEPERTDMVEYFAEHLEGFVITDQGWVQSYGTRCVKPPILLGDVERTRPITVPTLVRAKNATEHPVKGMLTGPVTILKWSFVRDDQPLRDSANQIALAIREEIADLEAAGISLIQVDEPALREGMPLAPEEHAPYLDWAVDAFRLATAQADPATQIHTHMCYADFGDILASIVKMDADVISLECARSSEQLLGSLRGHAYPNAIGPGVYDIHSPRVPDVDEMVQLLEKALEVVPAKRLWVNPDCGLKTRSWNEVEPALSRMVEATRRVRRRLQGSPG